jgi:hypothetical protein
VSNGSVAQARARLKVGLSWVMVGLGLSIGLYLLGALEVASTPISYDHTSWFFKWCELLGIALLAVELIAASLIAVHSRRRAGIFFLASLPITVFCLAYREVHFMSGGSETYSSSTGFQWLGSFFVGCVLLLFFGLFWLGTHWRRWPALTQLHPETFTTRMSRVAIACLMVAVAIVPLGVACVTLRPSNFGGHCGVPTPFIKPKSQHHVAFTARAICVGMSPRNWLLSRSGPQAIHEHRVGEWAIGVVQDRFWGVPSYWPHLVMLTDNVYWQGETYFVDGDRGGTLLSYFVPVVSAQYPCSRTRLIQKATLDLRILRRPPSTGATIIGYVRQPEPFHGILERPSAPSYLSGAQIEVSGPNGKTTLTADASGIYRIDGLPAGDYSLQLLVPSGETVDPVPVTGSYGKTETNIRILHLNGDELVERTFNLDWASKDKSPKQ